MWHGWTTPGNADAYEHLLLGTVLPGIKARAGAGYHGAYLYRRSVSDGEADGEVDGEVDGELVEFVTTMFFDSLDDVRAFAGEAYEVAVVPPAARALLARFDARSSHYQVLLAPSDRVEN